MQILKQPYRKNNNISLLPILPASNLLEEPKKTKKRISRQRRRRDERIRVAMLYRELEARNRPFGLHYRYSDRAMRLESCSRIWRYERHIKTAKRRAVSMSSCDDRFCPSCSERRAVKLMKKYQPLIQSKQDEGSLILFLTLTLKNTYTLSYKELQERLWGNWNKLRRAEPFKNCLEGALASMEITGSSSEGWHSHLHIILVSTNYIEQSEISARWLKLTGDSYIVDIRKAKDLRELLKYPFKPQQIQTANDLEAAVDATFALRMVRAYGCLWGAGASDLEPDSIDNDDVDSADSDGTDLSNKDEWELVGYFDDDIELREMWLAGTIDDNELRVRGKPLLVC